MPVIDVPLSDIKANPKANVREANGVESLAASMKKLGQLSPVGVIHTGGGNYDLVFGFRRMAAAKSIGWSKLGAVVLDPKDAKAFREAAAVAENMERVQLTLQQEVDAVGRVKTKLGKDATIADVAAEMGMTPAWAAQRLALVRLIPKWWKKAGEDARISRRILYALARLHVDQQEEWLERSTWHFEPAEFAKRIEKADRLSLVGVAWSLDDKDLVPNCGACNGCEFRGDVALALFPDAVVDKNPTCMNSLCFEAKSAAALRLKVQQVKKEIGRTPKIMTERSHHNTPFKEAEVVPSYTVAKCTVDTKGAFPVITPDKPDKVQWVRPSTNADSMGGGGKKSREAAPPTPKSDAVRFAELKRKRVAAAVRSYCEQLPKLPCSLKAAVALAIVHLPSHAHHKYAKESPDGIKLDKAIEIPEREWAKTLWSYLVPFIRESLEIFRIERDADSKWKLANEIAGAAGHVNDLVLCLKEANEAIKTPKSLERFAAKIEGKDAAKSTKKKPPGPDRRRAASGERD